VNCYLRSDDSPRARLELHSRIAKVGRTLCVLHLHDVHGLYLFENGVRLDVDFKDGSILEKEDPEVRILLDPNGDLADRIGRAFRAPLPHHPAGFSPGTPPLLTGSSGCSVRRTAGRCVVLKATTESIQS
jgi:hypothetical protein